MKTLLNLAGELNDSSAATRSIVLSVITSAFRALRTLSLSAYSIGVMPMSPRKLCERYEALIPALSAMSPRLIGRW